MADARLRKLVVQHAQTSRLLGVDFVPAYSKRARTPAEASPPPTVETSPAAPEAPARKPAPQATPARPPAAPEPARVELKPREHRDAREVQKRLDELRARYEADAPHQHFVTAHTRIVFGEGDPCARLVFVGEAPGEEEDRLGRPFVGRSGQLLEKMIVAMGLSRERVYICNVLKTRPPNNATPTGREIELCEPYLREQLAIIAPDVIVTLGLPASRAILKSDESMTKMRGRWRTYALTEERSVAVMPTYHPAYVLRNYTDETRRVVWSDLQQVMERLGLAAVQPGQAGS
jgi:uracil-DNA glycosylase